MSIIKKKHKPILWNGYEQKATLSRSILKSRYVTIVLLISKVRKYLDAEIIRNHFPYEKMYSSVFLQTTVNENLCAWEAWGKTIIVNCTFLKMMFHEKCVFPDRSRVVNNSVNNSRVGNADDSVEISVDNKIRVESLDYYRREKFKRPWRSPRMLLNAGSESKRRASK